MDLDISSAFKETDPDRWDCCISLAIERHSGDTRDKDEVSSNPELFLKNNMKTQTQLVAHLLR